MLYTLNITDQYVSPKWEIISDQKTKSKYIANKDLNQKIKIGKNVKDILEEKNMENTYSEYEIDSDIFFTNNFKNLKLNVLHKNTKEEKTDDNSILYLSLAPTIRLLQYDYVGNECVSTFYIKDVLHGCAILFNENRILNSDGAIIKIRIYDESNNTFSDKKIYLSKDEGVLISTSDIKDPKVLSKMKELVNKKRRNSFKYSFAKGKLPSNVYLVPDDLEEDFNKMVEDHFEKIKGITPIFIDETLIDVSTGNFFNIEDCKKACVDVLSNPVNSTVSTVGGIKFPFVLCKDLKVKHVFSFDIETLESKNVK